MSNKRTKLILGLCLLLGILLCILGCLGLKVVTQSGNDVQHPRRRVIIAIDINQRDVFFDQLRKFADKHNFRIIIDTRSSGKDDFIISIYGDDVRIDGTNPFVLGEYKFGFYDIYRQPPVSESVLDDLVNDLQSFISEVPSATFSVEEK